MAKVLARILHHANSSVWDRNLNSFYYFLKICMLDDTEAEQIHNESAETTYHVLQHEGPPSVPPSPEGSRTLNIIVTSENPARSSPSPQSQPRQSGSPSTPCRTVRKMLLKQRDVAEDDSHVNSGHSSKNAKEVLHQHQKSTDPQTYNVSAGTVLEHSWGKPQKFS